MEFVPTNLANGVLGTSPSTLFVVPVAAVAMLRSIVLVNKGGADVTVTLTASFGAGGTARHVIPPAMRLRIGHKFDDNSVITLPAESLITGSASVDASVDYIISGVIAQ